MKTKKYRGGGQGYADREDESLGMRTGAERTKRQSMRDRRDESYGAWGKRPNQRINRKDGGVGSKGKEGGVGSKGYGQNNKHKQDAMEQVMGEGSRAISDKDREYAAGKPYAHGGVEAADKEGDRLSISMERQEDAGFSPSQADFDQQHRLAEEGIMDVGAAVTIVQGHDSREKLGETDGVRGTGAMVKGMKFRGTF